VKCYARLAIPCLNSMLFGHLATTSKAGAILVPFDPWRKFSISTRGARTPRCRDLQPGFMGGGRDRRSRGNACIVVGLLGGLTGSASSPPACHLCCLFVFAILLKGITIL